MGITAISPTAASTVGISTSSLPGNALPLPDSGLPIDFAALLIAQITRPQAGTAALPETSISSGKPADEESPEIINNLLTALDPALNPQIALPYSAPPLPSEIPVTITSGSSAKAALPSRLTLMPTTAEKGQDKLSGTEQDILPTALAANPNLLKSDILTPQASGPQNMPPLAMAASIAEAAIVAGECSSGNAAPATFASILSANAAAPAQPAPPASPPPVATPLQDSRWPQDFGDRIVWMAKNDQQQAQINITPPQLGPIQITLSLNGDQASIAFASPHAEVRKAIEDAMPNLREMLSSSGINLGQSDVGAELKQQQRELTGQFANGQRSTGETAILPADSRLGSKISGQPIQQGRGLVDLFA